MKKIIATQKSGSTSLMAITRPELETLNDRSGILSTAISSGFLFLLLYQMINGISNNNNNHKGS
jgi:high-affinity nickel permease